MTKRKDIERHKENIIQNYRPKERQLAFATIAKETRGGWQIYLRKNKKYSEQTMHVETEKILGKKERNEARTGETECKFK